MHTLMKLIIAVFVFATLVVFGSQASAQMAHHERVKVTPIRENNRVVGAHINMTLRSGAGYDRVRVGLGGNNYHHDRRKGWDFHRPLAAEISKGYLIKQWGEITGFKPREAFEKTFDVFYGRGNQLKGGEKVEVISAWGTGNYWHIWGMQGVNGQVRDANALITLPK